MSDPMSVVEIEDVLSSIRRLVSEDLRPTHKLVAAALKNGAAKLILTPALRVVPNDASGLAYTADPLDDPGDLQSVLDGIEATETTEAVEIVPMFGSVRMQEMADIRPDGAADTDAEATDANFLASAMSRINGLSAADPARGAAPETIEEVVAAVGAAVGPEEWELDGGEPAPQAAAWEGTNWNSGEQPDAAADQDIGSAVLVLSDPVVGASDADGTAASNDTNWQEPTDSGLIEPEQFDHVPEEAALTAVDAMPHDDRLGQDSIIFHDDISVQSAALEQEAIAETEGDIGPADQDSLQDADDAAEYLNEDLLRDIVRDMIQAELQGTLGERITRNVRKLVRSEINRALAARDYE